VKKAAQLGVGNISWLDQRAEDVDADGYFELVAVGKTPLGCPRAAASRWCGATRPGWVRHAGGFSYDLARRPR